MSESLAGKTLTVTTSKNLDTTQMATLIQNVFSATSCPRCTSGGHFILRQELELPVDSALKVHAVLT